jgi:hypothetical protein
LEVLHEVTVVEETDSSDLCDQNYDTSRQQMNSLSPLTPSVEHGYFLTLILLIKLLCKLNVYSLLKQLLISIT